MTEYFTIEIRIAIDTPPTMAKYMNRQVTKSDVLKCLTETALPFEAIRITYHCADVVEKFTGTEFMAIFNPLNQGI